MLVAAALLGVITLASANPVGAICFLLDVWWEGRGGWAIAVLAGDGRIVGYGSVEYVLRDLLQMSVPLLMSLYVAYDFSILIHN